MTSPKLDEEAIFKAARRLAAGEDRAAYLDRVCGGDDALLHRVHELLRVDEQDRSFMAAPALGPVATTSPLVAERAGSVIGGYKLLEPIGEGGFGVVFMAEQTRPVHRKVALKVLKPGMDTRQVIARFEAERQALAIMDHQNIAKVFDGGATESGRPYFVMELVKGIPVTEFCDGHHLTPRQRLQLFTDVCHAVQHAHHKGIVHRDLKPSNVLVTVHDTTPVVKVIDFGVAKALGQELTDKTLFTGFAQMIGTPLYMSPEQAGQSGLDIDTRSDIYSLGVLLYELLTGTTPFRSDRFKTATYDEIRRIIREEDPPRPSTRLSELGKSGEPTREGAEGAISTLASVSASRHTEPARLTRLVRGELDWIVMKALEKDRNRRYETASGFAADIQRYLNEETVQACPPSAGYRFRKFARRNRAALVSTAATALAVVAAVAGLATSNFLIAREQQETAKALHAANMAKDDLKQTNTRERNEAYFRRIALAHAALSANDLGGALGFLKDCPESLRGWEWHYLMRFCRVDPVVIRSQKAAYGVAFAPDGERVASADGDGVVRIWNSRTGRLIRELKDAHRGFACCVAFHPHGSHVASVGADGRVKVWDLTADKPRPVFEAPCDAFHPFGTAYSTAFSPLNPDHIAVGCDGIVTIWNWRTEQAVHRLRGHETDRICVAFSPDGQRLATGNWQGVVKVWDAVTGAGPLQTLTPTNGARHPVVALAFNHEGSRLAAASFEHRVDVWDTTTGQLSLSLPHPGGLVLGVAISRDGHFASVAEDKIVRVWDATGRELLDLRRHNRWCGCVAFSSDGLRLATAGSDGIIPIWDSTPLQGNERQESASYEEHTDEVWSVAINPVGPEIVSAGSNMPARVWDSETVRERTRFSGHGAVTFCVAWHPEGNRIASAGSDNGQFSVKVWDAKTGAEVLTLQAARRPEFFAVAFSPDGRFLVTGRGNGAVEVWDANDGKPIRTLGTHNSPVRGLVFSPDRRLLATSSASGQVKLWDATRLDKEMEPQEPLPTFQAHSPGPGMNVAFSPDGKRLAMSHEEFTITIFDVQTGKELRVLRGHNGDVYCVAFSPDADGRWVASAGEDQTVRIWDSHTGKLVRLFRGHTSLVRSLAFTRDGELLVSGSRDHKVKLWDMTQLKDVLDR